MCVLTQPPERSAVRNLLYHNLLSTERYSFFPGGGLILETLSRRRGWSGDVAGRNWPPWDSWYFPSFRFGLYIPHTRLPRSFVCDVSIYTGMVIFHLSSGADE